MFDQETPVGFIGLGKMGAPMVRRLMAAGFDVTGTNRSRGIVSELEHEGMNAAADSAEVVRNAEVIVTALPDEPSVEAVLGEILQDSRPDQMVIDHSTISPGLARDVSERLAARDVAYLDAPVSGGPAGAASGTLTVMVGGDRDHLETARAVLEAYGDPIRHCGDTGSGQAIKLVNQLLVAIHTAAAAEAAAFGARMGVDSESIGEVLGTSYGGSAMLARNLPRFRSGDYTAATPVSLLKKDLSLIHGQAEELGSQLPLGDVAASLFTDATERGFADEDMAALYRLFPDASSR